MHFRLFSVFLLYCVSELAAAEKNVWDCEQGKEGEWSCVSQDKPESQTPDKATEALEVQPLAEKPPTIEQQAVYLKPPGTVAKRPGWTCSVNKENETWDCSLMGTDPKGKSRVVEQPQHASGWLTAAYDFNQEETFKTLQSRLPYDPWQNCNIRSTGKIKFKGKKDLRETMPMDVNADYSEVFDNEITRFFGNVDIVRADQKVSADMASYDLVSETMDAQGHVFYSEDELSLYSDTALLKLNTDEARLRNALFISPSGPVRGRADVVYRDSKTLSRYNEASFTSCRPGNQDWIVHAKRLKMNRRSGKASAKNVWLEFKGLPVLYTPYISFPLDDRRLSGFLTPTWGSTQTNGFDLAAPYYWNIAPNYDAIITPRYLSKRGAMLRGQFRYLTKMSQGNLGLEFMPYDSLLKTSRYLGGIKAQSRFIPGLDSNIDLNYVSDIDYFNDLNNALGFSNTRYVRSVADLRFNREWIDFSARLENYQTIDRTISDSSKAYQKYPQIRLNLKHAFDDIPLAVAMENEYTYFYRSGRVSGQRLNVKPSISFPVQTAGAFFTPRFSLQHTQYFLKDQLPGKAGNISRTLPIFSADSGVFFERNLDFGGSAFLHTLEPRAFYLYIPNKDQSDIPLFDTSLFDLNFNSLFRENRFNGPDRIQDANQVTVALTSRLLDGNSGVERLKLSVGEIFYFRNREVVLTGNTPQTERFSKLIAQFSGQLSDHLSFSSGLQWSPEVNRITRGEGAIQYRNLPDKIINIGYRYRRDNPDLVAKIIQSNMSFRWPIYDNWYAVGRWQYSLKFNQTVESFIGLEKENCCWRFRIIGRRFVNSISNSILAEPQNALFVQLELKGLTSFGDNVDDFLQQNLNGYRKPIK